MSERKRGSARRSRKAEVAAPGNVIDLAAVLRTRAERHERRAIEAALADEEAERVIVTLWDAALAFAHLRHERASPFALRDLERGLRQAIVQEPVGHTVEVLQSTWAVLDETNWIQVRIDANARFEAEVS